MTARQTAAADLLRRNPKTPLRTLARRLYSDNPRMWESSEGARDALRYIIGHKGRKARQHNTMKHLERSKPAAPPSADDANDYLTLPQPRPRVWTWTPRVIQGPLRTLILSDLHIPYHDLAAIRAALNYGKVHGAECILLNGDIGDHSAVGFWPVDPRDKDYVGERASIIAFLETLREAFPRARIIYKLGNHDERYHRYLLKSPELVGIDELEFNKLFKLDDLGIEMVDGQDVIHLGRLTVIHGHEYRFAISNPVNPARGLYLKAKAHALCGHFHTSTKHSEKTIEDHSIVTWSTGCLCHDAETQVLTRRGWVRFPDLMPSDAVAEFNPKDWSIQHEAPLAFQKFNYDGQMYHFKGARVDQLVTPEHKMLYSRSTSKLRVASAFHVAGMDRPHIPISGFSGDSPKITEAEAALISWIVTEGTNDGGRISIYQKKEAQCKMILDVLGALKLDYSVSVDPRSGVKRFRLLVKSSKFALSLFDPSGIKRLPRKLLDSGAGMLKCAYEALIAGDGHRKKEGTDYFATIYDALADDFQELCAKIGYSCRFKTDTLSTSFKKDARIIRCLVRKFRNAEATTCTTDYYSGTVYDITTKSGFFVIRRNGLVSISGNCELHPQFRSLNNWEHGFAFVETDNAGRFEVANRVISKDGKVY